jgi:hypothetical protein
LIVYLFRFFSFLHDAAGVVLIGVRAGAGVTPLLCLLGKGVVHVNNGDVLEPQSAMLLPQMLVVSLHSFKASYCKAALLFLLGLQRNVTSLVSQKLAKQHIRCKG